MPKERKFRIFDLSNPIGHGTPLFPASIQIQPFFFEYNTMSRSRTRLQTFYAHMHYGTHTDAPAHVLYEIPNPKTVDQIPLENCYGEGVVVSIPKGKWEVITPEDLEKAEPKIEKGDIVIVNTGWHHKWGDNIEWLCYYPSFYKEAGEWFVKKGVKGVGITAPAMDIIFATYAVGRTPSTPDFLPWLVDEYKQLTGRHPREDFPEWEPCHRLLLKNSIVVYESVGGDVDKVTGKRCIIAGFPIRWIGGDGSWIRLVAIVEEE
ncbi:MAG: cyclase family protein [Candidatus Bathyarchaeia archaeon]